MWSSVAGAGVLVALFTLPGWALLSLWSEWRRWATLQRWCIAIGLSLAVYPVLFYGLRALWPTLIVGFWKLACFLILCMGISLWRLRYDWREQFAFDTLEWAALTLVGMTLFTRFWIIRDQPYPAWTDSLHHTLLTQLTAEQGHLPFDMEPYFPIPLGQYHLGLYALTGSFQILTHLPAHTALLWTAQALNGLCGLGVFFALDKHVGRFGAVVGVAVVGLFSHMPAWYVNWGRFTQLASQTILLIAWVVTWEALKAWKTDWSVQRPTLLWQSGLAALLNGAVFLFHFRVAVFYLPLLALTVLSEFWKTQNRRVWILGGVTLIGFLSLVVILPVVNDALRIYIADKQTAHAIVTTEVVQAQATYFEFPLSSVPDLAGHKWLLGLAGLSSLVSLARRRWLSAGLLGWGGMLIGLGYTYLLGVPLLNITNLGAVLVGLYLLIGLIIGLAAQQLWIGLSVRWNNQVMRIGLIPIFALAFVTSFFRATEIELYRYFVTPADVTAMQWINANTPSDARFAINTTFWLPRAPIGTDAGYWIPYFTGRQTTAGAMLMNFAPTEYVENQLAASYTEKRLETELEALDGLRALGVEYIYLGVHGNFAGPGLSLTSLRDAPGVVVVYEQGGVAILQLGG